MENDEERKNRGHLRIAADQEKTRLPRIRLVIDEVVYDTGDPETRLIGEINVGSASYNGESTREEFYEDLKQLYRTKDGDYFCYGIAGIEPINTETAHACMDKDIRFRRYVTDAQKKELEQGDERIKLEKSRRVH
jgi:hypothetical protein